MTENEDGSSVEFSFICPYCEKLVWVGLRFESDTDIMIFDCCHCFGSLGVLTANLEEFLAKGCRHIESLMPVFQFEDVAENEAGFKPYLNSDDCQFVPGKSIILPENFSDCSLN